MLIRISPSLLPRLSSSVCSLVCSSPQLVLVNIPLISLVVIWRLARVALSLSSLTMFSRDMFVHRHGIADNLSYVIPEFH